MVQIYLITGLAYLMSVFCPIPFDAQSTNAFIFKPSNPA